MSTPNDLETKDRAYLLSVVAEQAAKLDAVQSIADAVAAVGFTVYYTGQDVDDMIHEALGARS